MAASIKPTAAIFARARVFPRLAMEERKAATVTRREEIFGAAIKLYTGAFGKTFLVLDNFCLFEPDKTKGE